MRLLITTVLVLASSLPAFARGPEMLVDRVVVYKQQRKLVLLSQGKEVRSYRVALGGKPVGPKRQQGNHRTPEGTYVLDSRNAHSASARPFTSPIPTSGTGRQQRNSASTPAVTSCFTDSQETTRGWVKPTPCTIGQTGASQSPTKKSTKSGNCYRSARPSRLSPERQRRPHEQELCCRTASVARAVIRRAAC